MPANDVILITGMSGAGKTTFARLFEDFGYTIVTMGDVIRDLAKELKLELTAANLGRLARELRDKEGRDAVARRCVQKLKREKPERTVVDGIRSLEEVDVFREYLTARLVAVHASPRTRFGRLIARGRSDDAAEEKALRERDLRELGFGLGSAIAMADYMIVNEEGLRELKIKFEELVERLDVS